MRANRQRRREELERIRLDSNLIAIDQGESVPLYNPSKHRPGDTVRMISGKVVTIPELDADGQPVPGE